MDLEYLRNEDAYLLLLSELRQRKERIRLSSGKKSIEKLHRQQKKTARERIDHLIDENSIFIEIGCLAGENMYLEHGGCPAGGTVGGIGYVSGKQCVILANDPAIKAGAWFPITVKKNLRLQEIAYQNRLPIIYLVDSAGVYLPLQEEIFPDKEDFGRIFRNNSRLSAAGIPQIAAVLGPCVAGGAYLPIMSDETLMVNGHGSIFLAGPYLVKAAIGEETTTEQLGGATTHGSISGISDYTLESEEAVLDQIKKLMKMQDTQAFHPATLSKSMAPAKPPKEIYGLIPTDATKPYDTYALLEHILDANSFIEFKKDYGKTIICGYARIEGWPVGIVANQRKPVKNAKGEWQIGGVIYNDSADKAARFILNCNQKKIPLVFFQDVTGFMVGSKSEQSGIIKDGAKMIQAVSNSIVPKFTIIMGNSYGAGNYAMCGKAYDPRLIAAWPSANIAVMGGEQAAKTLWQIQRNSMEQKGERPSPQQEKVWMDNIISSYKKHSSALYAAAHLWIDDVIDPANTRTFIAEGIKAAYHAPIDQEMKLGVFQV